MAFVFRLATFILGTIFFTILAGYLLKDLGNNRKKIERAKK